MFHCVREQHKFVQFFHVRSLTSSGDHLIVSVAVGGGAGVSIAVCAGRARPQECVCVGNFCTFVLVDLSVRAATAVPVNL